MRSLGWMLTALVAGCSGGSKLDSVDDPDAGRSAIAVNESPLPVARSIARSERSIAEVLRGRIALHPVAGAVESELGIAGDLALHVGAHANEPTRIGTDDDHSVSLTLLGAAEKRVEIDDGAAYHRDVYAGTDAIWATTEARAELLFLLRDASAPTHFRLHLERGPGLTTIERSASTISFRDDRGNLRLQIPRPFAIDAQGTRREATLTLSADDHTLEIDLDDAGLVRPILLDPAVLQARWVAIGVKDKRTRASFAWDPVRANLLAFGGYLPGSFSEPGAAAHNLLAYGFPAHDFTALADGPAGYFDAIDGGGGSGSPYHEIGWSAAFDSTRGKLVAIGSDSTGAKGHKMSVWEWTSATNTWAQACTTPACIAASPGSSNASFQSVYDPVHGYTLACPRGVGGSCTIWNGATSTWSSTTAFPSSITGAFWDTSINAVVVIDGNGTYSWSGSAWVSRSASKVYALGVTYDTIRKRAIAVTGPSGGGTTDTYEWNGTTWTNIISASTSAPFNKANPAFGFDPVNGRAVLWGGGDGEMSYWYFDFLGNVFEYQAFGNTCAGDVDCLGGSCRDGFCCDSKCGSCRRCDGPGSGGVCAVVAGASTGTEHDVCTGTKACDPSGNCKSKNGQTCTAGTDCISGACVDGYCCGTACNQACEVCNATPGTCTPAAKGTFGRSGCGTGTCNGTSRTCSTTCATDADCSATGYCNAGACVATFTGGAACTRDRQCATGTCTDGFCCDSACNGPCETCAKASGASANGVCTALPASATPTACSGYACSGTSGACASSCSTDASCATGYYCDGTFCQKGRTQGDVCTKTAQCGAGLTCSDGVCCNSACDGICQACSALNKVSGVASGVCGPAKVGSDPGDRCAKDDTITCGKTGVCSATGTCALYAKGAACGGVSCEAGTAKGQTCDGLGACKVDTAGTACTPGLCDSASGCTFTCTTDAECDATGFCNGGSCSPRSPPGRTCTANNQCASGFCTDGVCCSTACGSVCEACNGVGTEGTCTAVAGPPREGHGSCPAASGDDACTAAACDGESRDSCKALAGPEVSCRVASCESAIETLGTKCDGSGKCPAASSRACAPYGCAGAHCTTACTSDGECAAGNRCDLATSKCISNGTCDGDHTVVGADGSKTDCTPYRCGDSGCKTSCASSEECAPGSICDGAKCITPAATDDSGGCSASGRSSSPLSPRWSTLSILALVTALSRRRKGAR